MAASVTQAMDHQSSANATGAKHRRTSQSVELKLPPNYPPFERCLDVRIPMHFSECRLKELKDPYDFDYGAYQDLHYEVQSFFSGKSIGIQLGVDLLDKPLKACFQYCVMKPQHRWSKMQDDVRFFAVSMRQHDINRWSEVHSRIMTLIHKHFPDLTDPPIRYFRMSSAIEMGSMIDDDYGFVDYDELDGY